MDGKLGGSEPGGRRTRPAGGTWSSLGWRGAEVGVSGWREQYVCVHVCACVGDGVTLSSLLVHQSLHYGRMGDLEFI